MDTARREVLRSLWPKVPGALAVLTECATEPCEERSFREARTVVLRWLQFSKACESHVSAARAEMRGRRA